MNTHKPAWKNVLLAHETILLVVLIAEWIFFDAIGRNFGTYDNTCDILRHSCEIGLLALAMTPVILTGGIDLSVGSLLGLCAILFGKFWRDAHMPIPEAAACTLAVGALAGGVNASLITLLNLPPLIVTLGTFSLFRGLAEAITHGVDTFTDFPSSFLFLGQERWLGIPAQAPVFIGALIFFWWLVHFSTFGRSYRAIGFAPEGTRYAGIPVGRRVAMTYVLAGIVSAIAAIIYTARLGQAKADAGNGYELYAITAVVLGGTSIFGGIGSVYGTLLGVAAIAVLQSGIVHALQPSEMAGMLTGALLILALTASVLPKMISRLRQRKSALRLAKQNT